MTSGLSKEPLTLLAMGDIYVDRPDVKSMFEHVGPYLSSGAIVMGNLETPACDRGAPIAGKTQVSSRTLRSSPELPLALKEIGVQAVSLANNHMMDFGAEGLAQTIELLDRAGVVHSGAGRNLDEAYKPAIIRHGNTTVAMLSCTSVYPQVGFAATKDGYGVATVKVHTAYEAPENIFYQPGFPPVVITYADPGEGERMLESIRHAKANADILVVSWHWGVSWGLGKVVGYQREMGRAAIDAGADLILGAHPHSLLGMEMYKGRLICYSLGNFAFEDLHLAHHRKESVIVGCSIEKGTVGRFFLRAVRSNRESEPVLLGRDDSKSLAVLLEVESKEFGTTFTVDGDEVTVGGPKPGTPKPPRGIAALLDRMLPTAPSSSK